jgi:hypothetical protein
LLTQFTAASVVPLNQRVTAMPFYEANVCGITRIRKDATLAAHFDSLSFPLAANAILWLCVHAAVPRLAFVGIESIHADVATFTPLRTPRVTNQEVLLAEGFVFSVTHAQHSVIHDRISIATMENSRRIHAPLIGSNGENHGALGQRLEQWLLLFVGSR